MSIDSKVKELIELCGKVPFVEYYTHESSDCFKIHNPFTKFGQHTLVLCPVSEGFTNAVETALKHVSIEKESYERE